MLTDELIELFGDQISGLYQAYEQDVIADIARRVKKTGRLTETAELMARSMAEQGIPPQKIRNAVMKKLQADPEYRKLVANNTKQYKRDVIHKIREMEKAATEVGDDIIANAGDMSFNKDLSLWHTAGKKLTKDSSISKLIADMKKTTAGTLKNLTHSTGFKGAHDFTSIKNAYDSSLSKALFKMATGTFSFDRAAEDSVMELAHSGLRSVTYDKNGKKRIYQLDTASRMSVRTSCHQLSAQISMQNINNTGVDLVEVSSHWGARPEHAEWQGKIYSRSGTNSKYPDFAICRYGYADGLCGPNCRHTFYPFFEGISEPNEWEPEPSPKMYGDKEYSYTDATQKQRQMERDIRATKREIEAMKSLKGDTTALASKLDRQKNDYLSFSAKMKISPKENRLRVKCGTSDLNKTKTKKYYDSLVKSGSDDILKSSKSIKTIGNDSFRITKDKFIKSEYKDIKALDHSLSDVDVRAWYKAHDKDIINTIDKSMSIENQAKRACELINKYRTQARELMKDQEKRKQLDLHHPNKQFEELLEDKMKSKKISREEALKDIINTSGKTNKKVDTSLGLE